MGEGEARPTGLIGPVMGSEAGGGAARSPEGEDTAPVSDDALARRLPLDRRDQVCWADAKNMNMVSGQG